jgi:4-diphosphocytidyl-2C-methyl-D-erythritol kinase
VLPGLGTESSGRHSANVLQELVVTMSVDLAAKTAWHTIRITFTALSGSGAAFIPFSRKKLE